MPGVFISYRREDSAGHAGRLFDRLRAGHGHDRVFMDITGIEAGVDFVDTIERAIGSCELLLAVIGPEWLTCADASGRPRLTDPGDFIRIEIATALKRNVRVIPVLIAGASMPSAQALPDDLKPLTRRQAVELRDTRWDADTNDLMIVLERVLGAATPARSGLPSAAQSQDLTFRAMPLGEPVAQDRPGWRPWAIAALAASILAIMFAVGWKVPLMHPNQGQASQTMQDLGAGVGATPTDPRRDGVLSGGGNETPSSERAVAQPPAEPGRVERLSGETSPFATNDPPRESVSEVRVPKVEGLPLGQAARVLREAGLAVGSEESASAPGVKGFSVTKQRPDAGASVLRGRRVDLVYARPGRTLPVLTGRALEEAIAELRAAGFVPGQLTAKPTDKAPKQVLEQSHPPGSELEPGTRVDLVYAEPPR